MYKLFNCSYWLIIVVLIATSCINNEKHDCGNKVSVEFTYKLYTDDMKHTEAFHDSVNQVTLFVFDENGLFVMQKSEQGSALLDSKYRMIIPELPGDKYQFIVWGGISKASFSATHLTVGVSSITDLKVALCKLKDCVSNEDLTGLFYGSYQFDNDIKKKNETITIPLILNTNRFKIFLISYGDDIIDSSDYSFQIVDKNTAFNFKNELSAELEVTYKPYTQGVTTLQELGEVHEDLNSVVFAHLSTSKLFANHSASAQLRIYDNKADSILLELPLIKLILLMKRDKFGDSMSDQTYLDRIHSYSLSFILEKNVWIQKNVIINNWTVNLNEVEF